MSEQAIPVKPGDVVSVRREDGSERMVTVLWQDTGDDVWRCDDGWSYHGYQIVRHAPPQDAEAKRRADAEYDRWIADTNAAIDAEMVRRKREG